MSKGDKQRSNRETKKPKQDKKKTPPVAATGSLDRPPLTLGAKKPPRA